MYHLLNTLVAAGYVVRAPDSGLFLLGPRVPYLHAAFLQGLVVPERLRDCVEALSRVTGETGLLFQWWGDQVMCSLLIEGTHAGHLSGGYVGVVGPGHLMAVGQVLLAWAAPERVTAYLARSHRWPFDLPDRVDLPALRARLTAVRAAGYAVDRDSDGGAVCCVAAPIFGQGGQADHALGLIVHRSRFEPEEAVLLESVRGIARAANSALHATNGAAGHRAPGRRVRAEFFLPRVM